MPPLAVPRAVAAVRVASGALEAVSRPMVNRVTAAGSVPVHGGHGANGSPGSPGAPGNHAGAYSGAMAAGTAGPAASLSDAGLAAVTVTAALSGFAVVSDAVAVAVTAVAALTGFDSVRAAAPVAVIVAAAVRAAPGGAPTPPPGHAGHAANGWPPGSPGR